MKQITQFITAFCAGGILLGALYLLVPEGAFKKPLKYVFGVCFVCCIISFFPVMGNMDFSSADTVAFSQTDEQAVLYAARLTVSTALDKAGIKYSNVTVAAVYDGSGNITGLEVTVVSSAPPQSINEAVGNENIKVIVINE